MTKEDSSNKSDLSPVAGEVTELLHRWRGGSDQALEQLVPLVYDELKRIARSHMRNERSDHTLQPTALVNQAYLRLVGVDLDWQGRAHFLNMASRTMRRVLVDHARGRLREKRGSASASITLSELDSELPASQDLIKLDDALNDLASFDPRKAEIIQAHYFAGLKYQEISEVFAVSESTVHRELRLAKAWLARELA